MTDRCASQYHYSCANYCFTVCVHVFSNAFDRMLLRHLPEAVIDVAVCQCPRCDVKRNIKVYTNVTCSEIVRLNAIVHVHVLRIVKPLLCNWCHFNFMQCCSSQYDMNSFLCAVNYTSLSLKKIRHVSYQIYLKQGYAAFQWLQCRPTITLIFIIKIRRSHHRSAWYYLMLPWNNMESYSVRQKILSFLSLTSQLLLCQLITHSMFLYAGMDARLKCKLSIWPISIHFSVRKASGFMSIEQR